MDNCLIDVEERELTAKEVQFFNKIDPNETRYNYLKWQGKKIVVFAIEEDTALMLCIEFLGGLQDSKVCGSMINIKMGACCSKINKPLEPVKDVFIINEIQKEKELSYLRDLDFTVLLLVIEF